jgi:HAE1 family hydrophobic/amphiphilic exporter-1
LLKPKSDEHRVNLLGPFFVWFNRFFSRTTEKYVSASRVLIHKSGFAMIGLAAVALFAVLIGNRLPTGFLPQEDQGYFFAAIQLPDASSLQRTDAAAQRVTDVLLQTPGIQSVVGVDGFNLLTLTESTNTAFFFVTLKPWDERKSRSEQIEAVQASMQQKLAGNSRGLAFAFPPPAIPGIGTAGGVTVILQDRSGNDDPKFLATNVSAFLGAISKRQEIAAAIPSYLPAVPQLYAEVDRDKASQQQVDLSSVYTTMQTFMGGYLVNYFNRFGRQWQTYVQAEGDTRTNIQNVRDFYVRSANGGQVPLGALVRVDQITGPEFIQRFNEYNGAQINITGAPGYSSGQLRAALDEVFRASMPPGMGYSYQGMSFQEQRAAEGVPAWMVFGLSILIVFLILSALYESWTLPFSVLLSTPVAILGAYLALTFRSLENDIFATIGLIMLIGLSAKNAILIVEFAISNYEKGLSISESALQAARLRFRPIIMTALAFIFGCLPLWTASGSGAASRRILGTVVIGGMALASVLGILMVPVTFAVVEYLSHRFTRGGKDLTMDSTQVPDLEPQLSPEVERGRA